MMTVEKKVQNRERATRMGHAIQGVSFVLTLIATTLIMAAEQHVHGQTDFGDLDWPESPGVYVLTQDGAFIDVPRVWHTDFETILESEAQTPRHIPEFDVETDVALEDFRGFYINGLTPSRATGLGIGSFERETIDGVSVFLLPQALSPGQDGSLQQEFRYSRIDGQSSFYVEPRSLADLRESEIYGIWHHGWINGFWVFKLP